MRTTDQKDLENKIHEMKMAECDALKALQKEYNDKQPEDGIESMENYREPLSMDTSIEVNIMLSWGGPSDGYKLKFDKEQELISGVYWYADWGTYAESPLDDDEAQRVVDVYMYGDPNTFFNNV